MYPAPKTKGSALALVLTITIVVGIAIAYGISESNKKNYQVKDAELIANVRDGVKAAKQYLTTEVVREWQSQYETAGGGDNAMPNDPEFVASLDDRMKTLLQNRFSAREGWRVDFQPRSTAAPVNNSDALDGTYYATRTNDPFQYNIGVLDSWLQDGFNVRIGILQDPADPTSKLSWGARISSGGTKIDGKILYPTNFTWLDVSSNPNFSTANINVTVPKYINDVKSGIYSDDVELVSRRTGGIFINGAMSASNLSGVKYDGEKPVFVRGGVSGVTTTLSNTSSTTSPGANQTTSLGDNLLLGTTSLRSPVPDKQLIDLVNENTAVTNKRVTIYSETDMKNMGGTLSMFAAGENSSARVKEVAPSLYWNKSPVKQAADLKLNLYWNSAENRPTLVVPNPNPNPGYTNPLNADSNILEANRIAVWNYYGKAEWASYFRRRDKEVTCESPTFECFSNSWATLAPMLSLDQYLVRESYLNGAIRIQAFPEHFSELKSTYYVTVDPVRLAAAGYNGVYVSIDETPTNYNLMADGALMLVGRRLVNRDDGSTGQPIWLVTYDSAGDSTSSPTDYSVMLPQDKKMYFGTNGRMTIDTRINVDAGNSVDNTGNLLAMGSNKDYLLTPMANNSMSKKSVFASKQRLAVANLGSMGSGTGLSEAAQMAAAMNASITAQALVLGDSSFPGIYTDTGVVRQFTVANELMSLTSTGRFRAFNADADISMKPLDFDVNNQAAGITDVIGIKDLKNLNYTEAADATINGRLREWARGKIGEFMGLQYEVGTTNENPFYNAAIRYRLIDPSVSQGRKDEMLDQMLENLGRKEESAYIRVYAQRFGWSGTTAETIEASSKLNLRIGFSGNLKSRLLANCLDTAGNPIKSVLKDENLTLSDGRTGNYSNVPVAGLVSVTPTASRVNPAYVFPHNSLSFYTPGATAPRSMAALLGAYKAGASADLTTYFAADGVAQTPTILANNKAVPQFTVSTGSALYTILAQRLTDTVAQITNTLVQQSIHNGSTAWTTIAGATPLYGRMEYTVAVSVDTGVPSEALTAAPRFRASWTTDLTDPATNALADLRLYSVKFERYSSTALTDVKEVGRNAADIEAEVATLYGTIMQDLLTTGLSTSSGSLLQTAVEERVRNGNVGPLTVARIKDYMDVINALALPRTDVSSPIRKQNLTSMPGGINGERQIDYDVATASVPFRGTGVGSVSWDIYFSNLTGGHNRLDATNLVNLGLGTYAQLRNQTIASQINQQLDTSTSMFLPGRTNTATAANVNVMETPTMKSVRSHQFAAFEPRWNNDLIGSITTAFADSTQSLADNNVISQEIKRAVYTRDVKFKLYARISGTLNPPQQGYLNSFTGVGVLMTGANTPQPLLLSSANSDGKYFTWLGTVVTGIDTENIPEDLSSQRLLPAQLMGDPELVGPPPTTPTEFSATTGITAESRKGLWGTLMVIEDTSDDGDPTRDVQVVPSLEIR